MTKRLRTVTIILLLFLSVLSISHADSIQAFGDRDLVTVTIIQKPGVSDFYVTNKAICPTTFNIRFTKLENAGSDRPLPLTTVLQPGEKTKILTVSQKDKSRPWDTYFYYNWTLGSNNINPDTDHIYRLPFPPGQDYFILQGYNGTFSHTGNIRYSIDWAMPEGSEIWAVREGTVIDLRDSLDGSGTDESYKQKNNYVRIIHPDGTVGEYYHIMKDGAKVRIGQKIKAGELIALSGNVGFSTEPHLHFHVYKSIDGRNIETIPAKFHTNRGDVIPEQFESYKY